MSKIETLSWAQVEWWIAKAGDESVIGPRIREWRESRKPRLSHQQMAEEFSSYAATQGRKGMSKAMLVRLENNERKLTATEAVLIARFFGRTLPELLLPTTDAADVADLRLFDEATEALVNVRQAMFTYVSVQQRLRDRVSANPRLRAHIEARDAEAWSAYESVALGQRERVARTEELLKKGHPTPTVGEWLAQLEPTPEDVAARHALGEHSLSDDAWHRPRTWDGEHAKAEWKARSQTPRQPARAAKKGSRTNDKK